MRTVVLWLPLLTLALPVSAEEAIDFTRDIRPILSDRCFHCHGPGDQKAGLRLDSFEGATETAVAPGDPNASELIARVTATDELRMPPEESGKPPLTAEEIGLFRRWIESGASYQRHWSFVSLERPTLPGAEEAESGIDRFIARRLHGAGLSMKPPADRRTLIRRVTLDLIGLPPTPEEVEAFVSDSAPHAYERLVDRLLASPRYGEHMARYWLDAARYGDTHGLHLDNYREIWPYRDWVIDALNENQPFDQFIVEQLAGDLLPEPTEDQLVATGFLRCNVTTNEGGSIKKEVYTRNVMDRVDTYGAVFLGLTVGCAKCHDHKYDPVTMKDYYSLFAFFNSIDGEPLDKNAKDHAPILKVSSSSVDERVADLTAWMESLEHDFLRPDAELDGAQRVWEESLLSVDGEKGEAVVFTRAWRSVGPFSTSEEDLKGKNQGPEGSPVDLSQKFQVDGKEVAWRERADWEDGKTNFYESGGSDALFLTRELTVLKEREIEVHVGSDDGVRIYLNGERVHDNQASRPVKPGQDRIKLKLSAGKNELLMKITNFGGSAGFNFRFSGVKKMESDALALLQTPEAERTAEEKKRLRRLFRMQHGAAGKRPVFKKFVAAEKKRNELLNGATTTLIYRERKEPRKAYLLERGEYDQEREEVARDTPDCLPPMPDDLPRDRLGLARWTVSRENPLTARVAVNRFWQQLFGAGLVKTSDDFGSQGQTPSHPELLDWLAAEFTSSGWNVKALLKQMVMSNAYRQSSAADDGARGSDPANRILSRGPRVRLDAEVLRDQALAVSGLLVNRLGGPPVRPPQPKGLWKAVGYSRSNTANFVADEDPVGVHRRSVYTFHKRTAPPPQMSVLDGPSRESCTLRRERTNTPLQALMLMNDPQFVEAARALAQRVLQEASADEEQRASRMFQLCSGRPPRPEEVAELLDAVRVEREHFRSDPAAAKSFLAVGVEGPDPETDTADLAAWTLAANLILNLDEVVTKN